MLIAFCGIDGCGKTTQLKMVKDKINQNNIYITKQPTDFYRSYDRFNLYINNEISISNLLLEELALLAASDKLRHYQLEIQPFVESSIVLSDRYIYSSYAYFYARGLHNIKWLKEINKYLPLPDITFYFDIDPIIALNRVKCRDGNKIKAEESNLQILNDAREAFVKEIWGKNKDFVLIDANQSEEKIHIEVMRILKERIKNEGKTIL